MLFDFATVDGRCVVAAFDASAITSNAGALLLGATDRAITLVGRFAACCRDARMPERVEHEIATLVGQRVFGIALGHEDVVDQRPDARQPSRQARDPAQRRRAPGRQVDAEPSGARTCRRARPLPSQCP